MNYHDRPDGEVFVDVPAKPIPPADTWNALSVNQLLEVQIQLQTRAWEFRSKPEMASALNSNIKILEGLISRKLAGGA